MREIMDAMSPSHPCTDGGFVKGTQIAGSEAMYNVIGCYIDRVPCPIMLVNPTTDGGKRVSKQRLQPMIDETPTLAAKVKDARSRDSGNTLLIKEFQGGFLALAGANSGPGLRSMPVRVLMLDEVDAYPADVDGEGDPCRVAEKRTDTFAARAKRMYTSTPKIKGTSRIWRRYESGTQARYYVPCPHCGVEQWLKWGQMRWALLLPDTEELERVWYECESCAGEIEEHHKPDMLERGRHVHHAPGAGEYLSDNDQHPHSIWAQTADGAKRFLPRYTKPLTWHVSGLYSDLGFTWWKAVSEFLEAQKGGYAEGSGESLEQVFTNTVLGDPYEIKGEQPQDDLLKLRAEPYRLGTVPDGVLLLTAGVDVQGDRLELKVKGYGHGQESWLVDYQVFYGDPRKGEVWEAVADTLTVEYPRVSGATLRVQVMAIDSGFETQTVYEFCRKHARQGVFATKGVQEQGRALLGHPKAVDLKRSGKTIKKGLMLWTIGTDTAKERVYGALDLTSKTEVGTRGPRLMHFPTGLPDDYFSGLVAEKLVRRRVKGAEVREWVKTQDRNEPLDLEVMCYAAGVRAGMQRPLFFNRLDEAVAEIDRSARVEQVEPGSQPPPLFVAPVPQQPAKSGLFVARPGRRSI